jgi:hypothetical protein
MGKAFSCHRERRRTMREGGEAAINTVFADGRGDRCWRLGANSNDSRKVVIFFTILDQWSKLCINRCILH